MNLRHVYTPGRRRLRLHVNPRATGQRFADRHECFICSVGNEAAVKALFKIGDGKLHDLPESIVEVAAETKDDTRVAKETMCGSKAPAATAPVLKIGTEERALSGQKQNRHPCRPGSQAAIFGGVARRTTLQKDCQFTDATYHFCQKTGHLEAVRQ